MPDLRRLERDSIDTFLNACGDYFRGVRVLDYGAGQMPYRDLIESFGPSEYAAYDRADWPANTSGVDVGDPALLEWLWDVVVSTQTIQYAEDPGDWLLDLAELVETDGVMVLTGPTTWPIVEAEDCWRMTPNGIRRLLERAGLTVVTVQMRATMVWQGEGFLLGWGAVARA